MTPRVLWILPAALLALAGCDESQRKSSEGAAKASKLGNHECASCGMLVREQPSPRGQLVHRDGTRAHFCSIADMLTYLKAPSPHGRAKAVFVEAMPPDVEQPLAHDTAPRPWIRAEKATFVTGFERKRIMGKPYLVYDERDSAARIAESLGARVVDWKTLTQGKGSPGQAMRGAQD
jgi:nitrous oxide reductase accessory protein NosL